MSSADQPDMLAAALAAYDAGLCVVLASTDGTKKPVGEWKRYQSQRPTRDQVVRWFEHGHAGLGMICGAVSGDLEMFELEARFMAEHQHEFAKRMKAAGLELLLQKLSKGFSVVSPSTGRHFDYRIIDGPVDGNLKLARNAASETLIETRGEGGFVVLPPSHGTVHPSGKAWRQKSGTYATIPTITVAEREALFAVARSFDEAPAPQPVQPVMGPQRAQQRPHAGSVGDSWFEAVTDHLEATWTTQALLEHYGWTHCYEDRHGRVLMRRPGKDEGVSGSINANGRLHPFSTSVPFEVNGRATYDRLDIIAAYEHRGDRQAAARDIAETTGILAAWRQARDTASAPKAPPPGTDPFTGETSSAPRTGIDDSFWEQRAFLHHIRQAARARLVAPLAVLASVMARVAAFTPPSTCLPPIVGGYASLSLFVAMLGNSGDGKSSPVATAGDLLPTRPPDCAGPMGLGSGEGLVEAFMDLVEETDSAGKKRKVKRQVKHGVLFDLDEGQLLSELGARKGSTIMPILRTAWSGHDPGQANASIETRRSLQSGSYVVGLVSLWQTKAAIALINDSDGGTPQRFVWFDVSDHGADTMRPPWPGALDYEAPVLIAFDSKVGRNPLKVAPAIEEEIVTARVEHLKRITVSAPLDAHRRLNKLKIAGILTVLDSRNEITEDDWALAERIMTHSDQARDWVIAEARRHAADEVAGRISQAVVREAATEQSAIERSLKRAAKAVYRAVASGGGEPVGRRSMAQAINGRDRQLVTVDDAVAEAERLEWIASRGDGWVCGEAKPT